MSRLYGFFGDNVYRVSLKDNAKARPIDAFKSTIFGTEDTSRRSYTSQIKINTMDFYKEEPNEVLYGHLLNYIVKSKLAGIPTIYYNLKIALDYSITDENDEMIDGGVRFAQVDADDVYVLLDMDEETFAMPYRRAIMVERNFVISQIITAKYGVMQQRPAYLKFKINGISIYANFTDTSSPYYIQTLGPAACDKTFPYGSGTVNSIQNHSVVLFDTRIFGIKFAEQCLSYEPRTINVNFSCLLNQFCDVGNETEIQNILSENGGLVPGGGNGSVMDPDFGGCSPFDPIVNRPPCHGNHPMPPVRPSCPCPPPKPPCGGSNSGGSIIKPGEGWNPEGDLCPKPDYNQDHGDLNYEWCHAEEYDDISIKFLVVDDNISDYDFDATTMVKYSDVLPYVSDAKVGDYVKKSLTMYY